MGFYLYPTRNIQVFFGAQKEACIPAAYKHVPSRLLMREKPFMEVARSMKLESLVFFHQTHGIRGTYITNFDLPVFAYESDFLITKTANIGIAVATADCVPLIMYSVNHPVVGIVHAGWRGTVAEIMTAALEKFSTFLDGDKESIRIIIGPSARVCCYQVSSDFVSSLDVRFQQHIQERQGSFFFDVVACNKQIITVFGLTPDVIQDTNICTMHEQGYCSHRSSGGLPERQYAVVALK